MSQLIGDAVGKVLTASFKQVVNPRSYSDSAENVDVNEVATVFCPPSLSHPLELSRTIPRRVRLLYNPASGTHRGTKMAMEAQDILHEHGVSVEAVSLQKRGHAEEICRNSDFSDIDILIALGGDGTFHECVNGLMKRRDRETLLPRLPIALIAGGTGNSFALELHGETDLLNSLQHIVRGISAPIDLASVTFHTAESSGPQQVFCFNSIHWGLGSKVNVTAEKLRWMGSAARYTTAALLEIVSGAKERAVITLVDAEGKMIEYTDDFCLVIANNIVSAAKGMKMAPNAKLNDGLMDILIVRSNKAVDLMTIFRKVYDGTHVELGCVEYRQVRKFSIKPIEFSIDANGESVCTTAEEIVDIDGELTGSTPFECEILPRAIRVII